MIHAAESCKFLESFGNDLTIPVRTRSRLKHILLENTYEKTSWSASLSLWKMLNSTTKTPTLKTTPVQQRKAKASVEPGPAKQMRIG